jgi:hypothetical protein
MFRVSNYRFQVRLFVKPYANLYLTSSLALPWWRRSHIP